MTEIRKLGPGEYNVCYSCSARTSGIYTGAGCDKRYFDLSSLKGEERKEPGNCPFPSVTSKAVQTKATQAQINSQLRKILGK